MLTQAWKSKTETHHIYVQLNKGLIESGQKICGLILTRCGLEPSHLQRLKDMVSKFEPRLNQQLAYESEYGILSIVLQDQKLSSTHYAALAVKQFLQEERQFRGNLLTAEFSEQIMPKEQDVQAMLRMLRQEVDDENVILIYRQQDSRPKQSTILIIDEDQAVGELLDSQLRMKGYHVFKAGSGEEGLKMYDALLPDLVITELSLPVFDGFEVIRSIRKRMYTDCSIIVLSDNQIEKDISACFEMGVSDYIKKPYSPVELEARVRRLLD
jgi:two-component system OmpR family response regulator